VFNTILFDFHPETWVMPAFALALWAERAEKPRLWFALLLLMLGARDGLILVIAGMALDLGWRFSKFLRSLEKYTRQKFLQSAGIFLSGAVGMEIVGSYLVRTGIIRLHSIWYGSITGLEELLELIGLIIFLTALANYLIKKNGTIYLRATITK
jgi:uncharacterized membrane protein